MDWIRKNKFLASFLAVLIIGVGALGYLVYSQMDVYGQTSQDYDAAVAELQRLQGLKPYPFAKSKANLIALRGETARRVTDLQKKLADYEPPAEDPNFKPIDFQDKLRRVVDEITQAAAVANVALPKDFYMGFEQYRSTPPEAAAAPVLSRELDAVHDLLKILIAHRIDALTAIKRAPIPQEPGGHPTFADSAASAAPRPGGKPAPAAPADAVSRQVVELTFSGSPTSFRESLDDTVTAKRLFLVRALQVKNQKPKSPPRETPAPAAAPVVAAPADPNAAAALTPDVNKPAFEYIVGLEKLDVDMRVEIIRVAPPAVAAPAAGSVPPATTAAR